MIDAIGELLARLSSARAANLDNANGLVSTRLTALIKSVQTGSITATGLTTTATITSVNTAKTVVLWVGWTGGGANDNGKHGRLSLTNATTLTLTVVSNGGQVVSYMVVEFF